jgi:hypothetical protein
MHDFHRTFYKEHDSGGGGGDGDINNEGPSTTTALLFVRHEQGSLWFLSLAYHAGARGSAVG